MKSKKVELYEWLPSEDEIIDIDWPKVHKTIGLDQTRWFLDQALDKCQLILERHEMHCKLIAEFYDNQTLTAYHLMWASAK